VKPDTENIKRLKLGGGQAYRHSSNLAAIVELDKTEIIFAKPVLTKGLYLVHKGEFSITCYMCDTYT
jgi:hypothetical protein